MHEITYISRVISLLIHTSLLVISSPIFAQDGAEASVQDSMETSAQEKTEAVKDGFAVLSKGPRSDLEIQQVVKRYHKTLIYYYERELNTNPKLKGTIKVRLQIKADGSVSKVTVLENSVGSSKFARTVQKHCLKWQFKRLRSGSHTVELELPFETPGST